MQCCTMKQGTVSLQVILTLPPRSTLPPISWCNVASCELKIRVQLQLLLTFWSVLNICRSSFLSIIEICISAIYCLCTWPFMRSLLHVSQSVPCLSLILWLFKVQDTVIRLHESYAIMTRQPTFNYHKTIEGIRHSSSILYFRGHIEPNPVTSF